MAAVGAGQASRQGGRQSAANVEAQGVHRVGRVGAGDAGTRAHDVDDDQHGGKVRGGGRRWHGVSDQAGKKGSKGTVEVHPPSGVWFGGSAPRAKTRPGNEVNLAGLLPRRPRRRAPRPGPFRRRPRFMAHRQRMRDEGPTPWVVWLPLVRARGRGREAHKNSAGALLAGTGQKPRPGGSSPMFHGGGSRDAQKLQPSSLTSEVCIAVDAGRTSRIGFTATGGFDGHPKVAPSSGCRWERRDGFLGYASGVVIGSF